MAQLEDLLQQCTVQITIPGQSGWGTGFSVAPGLILTCAHVVKALAIGAAARIRWQQQADFATAELVQLEPQLDLALLQFTPTEADFPCVYLDETLQPGQELYFFGYPDQDFDNGCPVTGSCEGFTGDLPPLIKFKLAQVRPGMSGSALLNRHTGSVCGMVKFTRDRSIDLGGGAIPTRVILEQFPQLRELQQEFHQRDRRWQNLVAKQAEIDFQPYLESILGNEDYREWQEVYTPTKVEDRQHLPPVPLAESPQPRFSRHLKLRVKTVKPPESEHQRTEATDRQEQVEQLDVLAGLRKYAPEHVLLVGKPGSGKSTSLERLLWEEADQALKQTASAKIPVLVKLRRCTGTIESLMQDFCRSHQLPLTLADVETLLDQGKLLLLLDGFNELPEAFRTNVANFRDRYRATIPMIVSTRELSLGGNLGIAKTLKMLPLTEPQMQEFVRGYLGQEGNRLWQQLKGDRLRKFAETPLLLWMLCRVFAQNDRIPANLGLAFREFTQLYDAEIQQDAPAASREQWSKLLRHLAFALMHDQAPTAFRLSMSREEAADLLTTCLQQEGRANARDGAERGLKDLLSYHLLQPVMQPNYEEHIEFRHQLIQEYYAAEYLRRILPTLSDEQLKRDYLNYLKWTDSVALVLALVGQEEQAVRVVKLALDVDWLLGARLAGDVEPTFQAQTVKFVEDLAVSDWLKVQLLGETRSDFAIPVLLPQLEHSNWDLRGSIDSALGAASALGKIGSEAAIPCLLQRLKHPDWVVRGFAAYALGKIESDTAIPGLLKLVKDSNSYVRKETAYALGKIGSDTAIPGLLKLVEDSDSDVRKETAKALGRIGSDTAIPALLQLLEDSDSDVRGTAIVFAGKLAKEAAVPRLLQLAEDSNFDVRWRTTFALREIGSETAILGLLQLAEDSNSTVRGIAASGLGEIGSKTAISGLLQLLEHADSNVRGSAADGLCKIGSEVVIPRLLQLLEHADSDVRSNAGDVLRRIGSEVVIPRLLQLLEHADSDVRQNAANVLRKIGSEVAIPGLLQLLEHANSDVRQNAAFTLLLTGSEAAIPGLLQLLEHANSDVWYSAAWILGNIRSEVVIPDLLQLVKHANSDVSMRVVITLSNMRSEAAIPGLLQLMEHADSEVRELTVEAMIRIGSESAIPGLLELLKHPGSDVRMNAVFTLFNIRSKITISNLLQLLEDFDSDVRQSAAFALGSIGSVDAILALLELLEDPDSDVRLSAVFVLGSIWSETTISNLFKQLEASEGDLRGSAVDGLGNIGSEATLTNLSQQIKEGDVRGSVVDGLGNIGSEATLTNLIQQTKDPDSSVRVKATHLLGHIGTEAAISALLQLVEDSDSEVRRSVVYVLGQTGLEATIPVLLQRLEDSDSGVRGGAVNALDNIAEQHPEATAPYLPHLLTLVPKLSDESAFNALIAIQNRCKYYNHEIFQGLIPQGKTIALYFSSAPSDAELQTQLANHLNLLERQEIITSWHHRQMLPGDERAQVINDRLNSADIILLLISADSISDHTCYDIAINRAMERHQAGEARVIPILLRPVDWQGAPFSQLTVLPRNQQPVTSWSDRDAAFQAIAEGIRAVAIELRRTKSAGA